MIKSTILQAALVAGLALAAPMASAKAEPLKVVAFAGSSNWAFWVAQEKGYFAKHGVEPTLTITPGSIAMAKDLYAGNFDLALTAADNMVAYNEGQGETDLGGQPDFVILFGVDPGMLQIMAAPGIKSLAELKGKTIAVDAMTSGFAFVLFDALAKQNIAVADVKWDKVGGGAQRLQALLDGKQNSTLLNAPLDIAAEAKGFVNLQDASQALGAYQGISGSTRRSAAAAKRKEIVAFIRAFKDSMDWLTAPANREEAIGLLTKNMRGMDRPQAELAYAKLLDPKLGMFRDLRIDHEGMKTVLRLRSTWGQPHKELTDASRYIDESYLKEALK